MADGRWLTAEAPQIKYRIPHQLPRSVKSNIAASVALEDFNAAGGELFGRSEHVGSLGIASKGDDGRVFEQQQHVANLPRLAQFDEPLLQAQTFAVVEDTELDDRNHVLLK